MATSFADADELTAHLQHAVPPDVSASALAGASGVIRSYCKWGLSREDTTLLAEGAGGVLLDLPTLHLVTVTAIRINGIAADVDGVIVTRRGQLVRATYWPVDAQVEVDCTHGYDPIPDVVKLLTLTLAARIISNPEGAKSASVGSVSRSFDASLSHLDMRLLDPYRLE